MNEITAILQDGVMGKLPSEDEWRKLIKWELADQQRAAAFDICQENVLQQIQQRLHLLQSLHEFKVKLPLPFANQSTADLISPLWKIWLPLALQLADTRQKMHRPFIQGLLGGQGTGKTTLSAILQVILEQHSYKAFCLSLDDLYKTYQERCYLRQQDPRLIWRGPPGTHDINMGMAVLQQVRSQQPVTVPRFDKAAWNGEGDRTASEVVTDIDVLLFEGWFVGVRPIEPHAFTTAPPPITTEAEKTFARDMNVKLQDYCQLWEMLDRLILLYPTDYHLSQQWRRQAEQQMKATGKSGMSDQRVNQFVEYFWQALHPELFIPPLLKQQEAVDLIIEVQPDHSFGAVYKPGNHHKKLQRHSCS